MTWRLKRTHQCKKCPWIIGVDPHDIPDGYSEAKHAALVDTIATDPIESLTLNRYMACHETGDAHCVGWLVNQIGPGNHIGLRIRMRDCENADKIRVARRAARKVRGHVAVNWRSRRTCAGHLLYGFPLHKTGCATMIVRTVIVGPKGHANRYPGAAEELMLLGPGALIDLVAEPENQHDAKAVACYSNGVHLGYVPVSCAAKSQIFDRLADQDEVSAKIFLEAIIDDGRIVELPRITVIWED